MKNPITKVLTLFAACSIAGSASALTIIPTFDASITGANNAAAITNAIRLAVR